MWFELRIQSNSLLKQDVRDLVISELMARGASGCQEATGDMIVAYGEWNITTQDELGRWLVSSLPHLTFSFHPVDDTNWVAQCPELLQELSAGLFRVVPLESSTIEIPSTESSAITLYLAIGHGFGTGHHATTRTILSLLSNFAARTNNTALSPSEIVDIGTGSGILSIAAAKLFPSARIYSLDNDAAALSNAEENVRINSVRAGQITLAVCDIASIEGQFDLILANIYAEVLINEASRMSQIARPGCSALLSGIRQDKAALVKLAYHDTWQAVEEVVLDGWCTLLLEKRGE
jgi:ribosomal protein L11 methyltransferase